MQWRIWNKPLNICKLASWVGRGSDPWREGACFTRPPKSATDSKSNVNEQRSALIKVFYFKKWINLQLYKYHSISKSSLWEIFLSKYVDS